MKLTIIETGRAPAPLSDRWPRYPSMIAAMLEEHIDIRQLDVVSVLEGDAFPEVSGLDAVVVTGSPSGVYDPLPWIEPLKSFVRQLAAASVPQVGICFGHQLMAAAFGGHVAKAPQGWGIGRHTYALGRLEPWMTCPGRPELHMAVSHQDQVLAKPDVADVFASSDFTPFAGLVYRHAPAISFQGHPEFSRQFAEDLISARRGTRFSADQADRALESLSAPLDNPIIAGWIAAFFKANARSEAAQSTARCAA